MKPKHKKGQYPQGTTKYDTENKRPCTDPEITDADKKASKNAARKVLKVGDQIIRIAQRKYIQEQTEPTPDRHGKLRRNFKNKLEDDISPQDLDAFVQIFKAVAPQMNAASRSIIWQHTQLQGSEKPEKVEELNLTNVLGFNPEPSKKKEDKAN